MHPKAGPNYGTELISINNQGIILGSYTDKNGISHDFLYDGKSFEDINHLKKIKNHNFCMNDQKHLIGKLEPISIFYEAGRPMPITPEPDIYLVVSGTNDRGDVVGQYGLSSFVSRREQYFILPIEARSGSKATAINNRGHIVGIVK
jgi:hypothetical protein